MADGGVCSSGSDSVDDVNSEEDFPGDFEIGHWNLDADGGENEANDPNLGGFSQDDGTISYMGNTISLEFTKFSKGFEASDFKDFVQKFVGEENVVRLENRNHNNVWLMEVRNQEIRENLLRMWKTKIKGKACWIKPYHDYEMRGFLHWVPNFVSDDDVKTQLAQFGDVILLENETHAYWIGEIKSDVRYFGLRLKDGMVKNDLPHFLKFDGYRTLVIVRGRQPACFHCREFGHSKRDCKKYKERLDKYCKNPETRRPRTKPRGRRHRPVSDAEIDNETKDQDKINSNSASTIPAQKDAKQVKSCLKSTCSGNDKMKEEILVKPRGRQQRHVSDAKIDNEIKDQDKIDSNSASTMPAQKDAKQVKSCLKRTCSGNDKMKEEILAILLSLKEWKEGIIEMVVLEFSKIEKNLMDSVLPQITETGEESFTLSIKTMTKKSVYEMKQVAFDMIEQTLNNLKNIVVKHFGLNSNESLEKLIRSFEATNEEKPKRKEVRFVK